MARYIDAEETIAVIKANDWSNPAVPTVVKMIIDRIPTADVVEVVRCHNCEYHGIRDKCPLLNMSPYRDDDRGYCSEGKRLEWMEVIKELEHKGFVIKTVR